MWLVAPSGEKLKWDIRFRNWDGRVVRVPGDRDEDIARDIGRRIDRLVKAKSNGDPPPGDLGSWIANMEDERAQRLADLGLIPARQLYRHRAIAEWVNPWVAVVQGRKPDARRHAPQQGQKVRRIIDAMKAKALADLEADAVIETINAMRTLGTKTPKSMATSSRRGYSIAIKDFAAWVASKLKVEDPLADIAVPGQYENPEYERIPLTVKQFQKLMKYLDTFERYPNQKARWTAYDRKLIYWTAVSTGYRETELMKLRKWNFYLIDKPAVISLKPRDSKTKVKGEVPIPRDLALALKKYIVGLAPDDKVFRFPETSGSIVDMLRKDLEGAGIPWKLPSGEIIDFHTFRSTFITWALDVYGLKPKRVQILARLKSIIVLQNYSRNLRIEDFGWLEKGPKLVDAAAARRRRKAG